MKEIRVDKAQEVVEEYEEIRKEIREKYRKKRPKYQIESQDVMTVLTELDESLVPLNGFYDGITVSQVPAASRYGLMAEGLYTAEQIVEAGGTAAVSSNTGAASAGTIKASTGMSTAAIVGIGIGAAVVIGGGVAAVAGGNGGGNSGDSHSGINNSFTGTFVTHNVVAGSAAWDSVTFDLIQNGNSISGSYHGEANAFRSMFTCSITGTASGLSATLTCNSARGYYYEAGWYPLPNLEGYLFTMTLVNDGNILRGNGHDFIRQ